MAAKLSITAARRHFGGSPPACATALAEPRTVRALADLIRGRRWPPEDAIDALRDIRRGVLASRAVNLPGLLNCLGGLGLVRLHGDRVTLRAAAHDLLADAERCRL
ncbi:hypothetical protein ASF56_12175 [Methylobacterium sp. Leaf122]|nr:hypothetical protein [Methylobacterium sp. Leaf122]KQQ04501.1 hypothetical protein ASF56_12175 [Methylobacterium sp. Leaf122]